MRIDNGKGRKNTSHARRVYLFALITITFFSVLYQWVRYYDFQVFIIPENGHTAGVLEVTPAEISGDLGDALIDTSSPSGDLTGQVITCCRELMRSGVIPAKLPINIFRAPRSMDEKDKHITRDKDGVAIIRNKANLTYFMYDCLEKGCDTFCFKTGDGYRFNMAQDLGGLYLGSLFLSNADVLVKNQTGVYSLHIQGTDSANMLRAVAAELRNTSTQPASEWGDLTPDELTVLSHCLGVLQNKVKPGMKDSEIAQVLAKYLCDSLEYHKLERNESVYYRNRGKFVTYAIKPLATGHRHGHAICEGYAKTYSFLLTLCGITSMEVNGIADTPHAWNLIYLKDKKNWYHVDTTWMDEGSRYNLDYYLGCDDDMKKAKRIWPNLVRPGILRYPASGPALSDTEKSFF